MKTFLKQSILFILTAIIYFFAVNYFYPSSKIEHFIIVLSVLTSLFILSSLIVNIGKVDTAEIQVQRFILAISMQFIFALFFLLILFVSFKDSLRHSALNASAFFFILLIVQSVFLLRNRIR